VIQRALENFGRPLFRQRSMRVFRDDASLTMTPELWSSLQRVLDRSRYFLLLASPESAKPDESGGPGWPTEKPFTLFRDQKMKSALTSP
jgi:hypothetical protein